MVNACQLINQTSGEVEYYTPQPIIEAARETMGGIDLDPACSDAAALRVCPREHFSKNGLEMLWGGRVWMNHPFGRAENPAWTNKLLSEWAIGRMSQACCITYACTSESWFQPLMRFPQCFLSPRTNYYLPDGTLLRGVSKGSVVTYLGPKENTIEFAARFRSFGIVKVSYE